MLPAFFVLWNLRLEVKMFPDSDIRVAVAARDSTHHRRSIALQYGCSKKPMARKPEASRFLGSVVGAPVARPGDALLDRDFDLRGDDPVEVAASERVT